MYVTVITNFCRGGGVDAYAGDVLEMEPREATARIYGGTVREATADEVAQYLKALARKHAEAEAAALAEAKARAEAEEARQLEMEGQGEEALEGEGEPGDAGSHPEAGIPGLVVDRDPEAQNRDPRPRGKGKGGVQ